MRRSFAPVLFGLGLVLTLSAGETPGSGQDKKKKGDKNDVVLREGACYVRRRGRIETSELPTHVEMRDLLELATEKGIRRFLKQVHKAGLDIAGMRQVPDDAALFDKQRGEFR